MNTQERVAFMSVEHRVLYRIEIKEGYQEGYQVTIEHDKCRHRLDMRVSDLQLCS
jgi:hypothetical protein